MKVWHCKKQNAFRNGLDGESGGQIRTRSTSDKIDNALAALLNDAIPVKFHLRSSK